MRRLTYFFFFLFIGLFQAKAQNYFIQNLDSTNITIGDQLYLTQKCNSIPKDNQALQELKSLGWFEIISPGEWILTPQQYYERKIKFSVYDSGVYTIPILNVKLDTQIIQTIPLSINVEFPMLSNGEIRPIKDIIITSSASNIIYYIILGIIFLCLVLVLLFVLYRADRVKPKSFQYLLPEHAHELSLRRLNELESKKLWQSDQIKNYYDELNNILRTFLFEGFKIPALESTSNEIIDLLDSSDISWSAEDEFIHCLRFSDLIRFANKSSVIEDHLNWMSFAKKFVISNKESSIQFLDENKKDYLSLLGPHYAAQFQQAREIVPESLIQLYHSDEFEELLMVYKFNRIIKFQLPVNWVNLHRSKLGQLSLWHVDLFTKYSGFKAVLLLIVLIPIIALFLPILYLVGLSKKENIFNRGIFLLSNENKLLVDSNKL
ncbi:MAG: hypothetical protein ABI851_15225 [Saprospiraceae bacterium]